MALRHGSGTTPFPGSPPSNSIEENMSEKNSAKGSRQTTKIVIHVPNPVSVLTSITKRVTHPRETVGYILHTPPYDIITSRIGKYIKIE
jgi:hypothetical protein